VFSVSLDVRVCKCERWRLVLRVTRALVFRKPLVTAATEIWRCVLVVVRCSARTWAVGVSCVVFLSV